MRLVALDPHWITRAASDGSHFGNDGTKTPGALSQAEAQGIRFLCPKCFGANRGDMRGVHSVIVPFEGRGLPIDWMPQMPRWQASGHSFDDLSIVPSILLIGGCAWHGFITNGEVTQDPAQ